MRIGIMLGATAGPDAMLAGLLEHAQKIESKGSPSLWLAQVFGFDAITSLALVGRETRRLELGAAIDRLAETGVTDFIAAVEAGRQRMLEFLAARI